MVAASRMTPVSAVAAALCLLLLLQHRQPHLATARLAPLSSDQPSPPSLPPPQPDGAAALAKGLAANRTLQNLVLAWNGLETEGVASLGQCLAHNEGLKCLDLAHTRCGPRACLLLAEGLRANGVLEVLLLNGNQIGEDGARHLMHALTINKSLKYLGLQVGG
jgi:hypothetical protein